eukprot:TRINITY_DN62872_c0_g1_i1.p1 TRINITY_DN62872_c0_g1~~TRINITY_DN62872_c0_g1_i1.p1  ORF type:complete len:451 (+),score=35.65 TRINITY_DN62872_c0_g1_i1:46-1353(+)
MFARHTRQHTWTFATRMAAAHNGSVASTVGLRPAKRACPPPTSQSQGSEVWQKLTSLGLKPGYVDLGQGKPEFAPASEAVAVAQKALAEALPSQYSPVGGSPALVDAVRRYVERTHGTGSAPADGECTITASATEGLLTAFLATLEPGDEVIVPQPCFPWYIPQLRLAGCIPVPVYLKAEEGFRFSGNALRAVLSPKTRGVIVNSPHNPTGHVCTKEELEEVACICQQHNLLAFADEVYERQTWGGHHHIRLADVRGMRERTLTFGSAGKLFCCTGWRVGWVLGPSTLVSAITRVHSYATYCAPTPLQLGIATALDAALPADGSKGQDAFTIQLRENAATLTSALETKGLRVIQPQGGYFLVADTTPLGVSASEYCERLAEDAKVVAAPMACFYVDNPDPNLVRFALCKTAATVSEAAERIRAQPSLSCKRARSA